MSLAIYSRDYSRRDEIANAISVQMSFYYNEVGKLILDAPINDHNISVLKNNCIVYDTERKFAYVIQNVKTDTKANKITANGFTTNTLLNKRAIAYSRSASTVEDLAYAIVNFNLRGLERISTAPLKGLTETNDILLYGGLVLDQITPVLTEAGLGNRMTWNHRDLQHTFEVYKGQDLTAGLYAVVFSDERGTARDLVITDDVSEFKNYAYIQSEFEETKIVEEVGDATGDARREQWFDISISKEDGETEDLFRQRMRTQGAIELEKLIRKLSFSVVADPVELGVLYNIGDIVSCVSKRFGVTFNARISGVKYKKDGKSETTELILGELQIIKIGEVKLIG